MLSKKVFNKLGIIALDVAGVSVTERIYLEKTNRSCGNKTKQENKSNKKKKIKQTL